MDNWAMFLAHIPINHHLRPLFRVLAVLTGLYPVAFGVAGLAETGGMSAFARDDLPQVLGQHVNPAYAVLSLVVGLTIIVCALLGRNIDHYVNFWIGLALLVIGLIELIVLRTDVNVLGFTVTNVIVLWMVALLSLWTSLYSRLGAPRSADAEPGPSRPMAYR